MNLLPGAVSGDQCGLFGGGQMLKMLVESSLREVTVGFRSEDVQVGPNGILEAVIHDVENYGMEKIVELRVSDTQLKATVPSQMQTAGDAKVKFGLDPDKAHFFNPSSGMSLKATV